MSNDFWQVASTIYGGKGFAPATIEAYTAIAHALEDEATGFGVQSTGWGSTGLQLGAHRTSAPLCPALSSAGGGQQQFIGHVTLPYALLRERCQGLAASCQRLAEDLAASASLLIRAHSLYSEAELASSRLFAELLQVGTQAKPGYALAGVGAVAAGGLLAGWAIDGKPNPSWMSTFTYPLQEGVLAGVGGKLTGTAMFSGLLGTDEVNQAAGGISSLSAPAKNTLQGNALTVREVRANAEVVKASNSVAESMENLRRLAEERLGKITLDSGLSYGTIAIQRYAREDGSRSWLVTIPGTDGQRDSPFGWAQNIELMSSDSRQRMQADSARMVVESMRQAGIPADEPVALIGHSQGGIVAATIASDWADAYAIEHVITAGSPVANHPVPERTWVTSVEIDDELVAALDGASNPATDHWLTVRGHVAPAPAGTEGGRDGGGNCTPANAPIAGATPYDAAPVAGSTSGREISHWLKYHQAAYQNATDLGSPAVQRHERHFRSVINGTLEETRYFEGRMSSSAALAPDRGQAAVRSVGE